MKQRIVWNESIWQSTPSCCRSPWLTHLPRGRSPPPPTIKALHWDSPSVDSTQAVGKHHQNLWKEPTKKVSLTVYKHVLVRTFGYYEMSVKNKTLFLFQCQSNGHSSVRYSAILWIFITSMHIDWVEAQCVKGTLAKFLSLSSSMAEGYPVV